MSIDHALVLLSVLIAFTAWNKNREYFLISMLLVADFCLFFGFDEILINTSYIDFDQNTVSFLKGFTYLAFYYLYLIGGSFYLAGLATLAALYHILRPGSSVAEYEIVMSIYCILQLLVAAFGALGVTYDSFRRNLHNYISHYHYSHRPKGKGTE